MNRSIVIILCFIFFSVYVSSTAKPRNTDGGTARAFVSVKNDENLIFFPDYACADPVSSNIKIRIHAWIYEPERDSFKRRAMIDLFRGQLGLSDDEEKSGLYEERAFAFLVDQESRKRISVRLGGTVYDLGRTGRSGHLEKEITVPASSLSSLVGKDGWMSYSSEARGGNGRSFKGRTKYLSDSGVLVVSDIDDTVKVSNVRDRKQLVRNTFIKEFMAVPGMSRVYSSWFSRGADFHYVSASPWQLYGPLSDFLRKAGFPAGFYHMKRFGFPANFLKLFQSPEKFKIPHLCGLVRKFHKRRFVLVGDSGERDPEIYGEVARKCPGRIAAIFIRNITDEDGDSKRMKRAFAGLSGERVIVFRNAEELRGVDIFR